MGSCRSSNVLRNTRTNLIGSCRSSNVLRNTRNEPHWFLQEAQTCCVTQERTSLVPGRSSNVLRNTRTNLIGSCRSSNVLRNTRTNLIGFCRSSNVLRNTRERTSLVSAKLKRAAEHKNEPHWFLQKLKRAA